MSNTRHNDDTTHRSHLVETRPARKTTELIAYVAALLAVAVTALLSPTTGTTPRTRSTPSRPCATSPF